MQSDVSPVEIQFRCVSFRLFFLFPSLLVRVVEFGSGRRRWTRRRRKRKKESKNIKGSGS